MSLKGIFVNVCPHAQDELNNRNGIHMVKFPAARLMYKRAIKNKEENLKLVKTNLQLF